MKEIGVGRERTIKGILQLCRDLKKVEMFRRYGKEALSFYEEVWEVKQATMKPPEMKKFLRNIKQLASSIGDHQRERLYDVALEPKQAASKSEEEEEEEKKEETVVECEEEIVAGSEEIIEVRSEEENNVGAEEKTEVGAEAIKAENRCTIFK
ncbi:hypothetical protein OS493_033116 [Desmophyllum pertusum]|uniref:Uncharacterized protein n=1 Tax=Desmophyllum pertusum TaxID=174260 RepID=A0A9X0CNY3_9CNID|nr:hypothetical protein OS493_033116 [Desmophyllum pertusum]